MKYSMGQVAEQIGVTKNTLFRWEKQGKVDRPEVDRNGHRVYTDDEVAEIKRRMGANPTALFLAKRKVKNGNGTE